MVGANGAPVPMVGPYDQAPPASAYQAQRMLQNSVPLSAVQNNPVGMPGPGNVPPGFGVPPTMVPRGGFLSPPGIPPAPGVSPGHNVPMGPGLPGQAGVSPASYLPAGMNPGLVNANMPPGGIGRGNVMPAQYAMVKGGAGVPFTIGRTQVKFTRPTAMKISWFTAGPDGKPTWSTTPIETPGRYNFTQAAIYRLKLTGIDGRPGLELYPTLEVVPCNPNTEAFLAHSSVPLEFTNEDFKQVAEGNYIVKVIYLPYPQFQDAAGTGTDEILSTRLEPGADPIEEARRRGSILLVIRMGNVDQEAPNTPPLTAPIPGVGPQPPQMMLPPGLNRPNLQMPVYGMPGVRPPGPQMPPQGLLPPPNLKDPGKATTGIPGGPINVPSSPLPGEPNPKGPVLPPGLDGKAAVPPTTPTVPDIKTPPTVAPTIPTIPAVKDGGKATPEFVAPKLPAPPAVKTTTEPAPLPVQPPAVNPPGLPMVPLPDLTPGPQSRQEGGPVPPPVEIADQFGAPRR